MRLVSVQIGRPRTVAGPVPFRTGFGKSPALTPIRATREGLAGDGVADKRYHGGPDQAALAYSFEHYARWRADGIELGPGGLGENLTVEGADEHSVCIGDVWRCGALFQVTSPRVPCVKISRFHQRAELTSLVLETGRCGWYLRVLEEGDVAPGEVQLVSRPHPKWTIARAMSMLRARGSEEQRELAALPELNSRWR